MTTFAPPAPVPDPSVPAAPDVATPTPSRTITPVIVEDGSAAAAGTMERTAFLRSARSRLYAVLAEELAPAGLTPEGCPMFTSTFEAYASRSAPDIEATARRYARSSDATAQGLLTALEQRAREATRTWLAGRRANGGAGGDGGPVAGAGPVAGTGGPVGASGPAAGAFARRADGSTAAARFAAPRTPGAPLDSATRTRMERAFGASFTDIRVHADAHAQAEVASEGALALASGSDIAFAAGHWRPGTVEGDLLLAHELAHTVQQRAGGTAERATLEHDADRAALHAVAPGPAGAARVARGGGLRMQACRETEEAPTTLTTPADRAAWIRLAMQQNRWFAADRIVDLVMRCQTAREFLDLQDALDLNAVFAFVGRFQAIRIGTLGPITSPTARATLNNLRLEYIQDAVRNYGIARAQVFTTWIFASATDADIRWILGQLAGSRRLHSTIGQMPAVRLLLQSRSIDLAQFRERGWNAGDIARGLYNAGDAIVGSIPLVADSNQMNASGEASRLPELYRNAITDVNAAEFGRMMEPGRAALGAADYLMFNIPSGAYGFVAGTIGGVRQIAAGNVEEGVEALVPAMLMILSFLGVRVVAQRRTTAAALRVSQALGLEGAEAALADRMVTEFGREGVQSLARYLSADAGAGALLQQYGIEGARALLRTRGNIGLAGFLARGEVLTAALEADIAAAGASLAPELVAPFPEGMGTGQAFGELRRRLALVQGQAARSALFQRLIPQLDRVNRANVHEGWAAQPRHSNRPGARLWEGDAGFLLLIDADGTVSMMNPGNPAASRRVPYTSMYNDVRIDLDLTQTAPARTPQNPRPGGWIELVPGSPR